MTTFSVILPVYNRAGCVAEAIRSILYQSRRPDEVIVVDDGSTDNLEKALAPFRGQITLFQQRNAGVSAARNRGVRASRGEWLTFLDSDDLWAPDRLAHLERDVARAPASIVAHLGDCVIETPQQVRRLFDVKGGAVRRTFHSRAGGAFPFVLSGMTTQCAAIRRTAFDRCGGFDEDMQYLEDTDLFCRLSLQGEFLISDEVMAIVRRLPDTGASLTDVEGASPDLACQAQIRTLRKLLALPLTADQTRLVRQKLSGAIFRSALYHIGDERMALLKQAAKIHPEQVKGRAKTILARLMGNRGQQLLLRDRNRLDRVA